MFKAREHPRVFLQAAVTIISRKKTLHGEANEIGGGGMSVRCAGEISVSEPVELEFSLSEGLPVRVAAVLWWKKAGLMGFRFDLFSENRRTIERWVADRIEHAQYFS